LPNGLKERRQVGKREDPAGKATEVTTRAFCALLARFVTEEKEKLNVAKKRKNSS